MKIKMKIIFFLLIRNTIKSTLNINLKLNIYKYQYKKVYIKNIFLVIKPCIYVFTININIFLFTDGHGRRI